MASKRNKYSEKFKKDAVELSYHGAFKRRGSGMAGAGLRLGTRSCAEAHIVEQMNNSCRTDPLNLDIMHS